MDDSPSSTSLGKIWGKLLCYTLGSIREKGKSNKGVCGMELNQSGVPLGLPLLYLHLSSVIEPGGMSKMPASVKDRLSLSREGKLQWKFCLHSHLEQGRVLPVEKSHGCGCHFFLSYRGELAFPEPFLYNVF